MANKTTFQFLFFFYVHLRVHTKMFWALFALIQSHSQLSDSCSPSPRDFTLLIQNSQWNSSYTRSRLGSPPPSDWLLFCEWVCACVWARERGRERGWQGGLSQRVVAWGMGFYEIHHSLLSHPFPGRLCSTSNFSVPSSVFPAQRLIQELPG